MGLSFKNLKTKGGIEMKKYISFVGLTILLSVLILGFMQFTNSTPAYALLMPCCNNLGYVLCPQYQHEPWMYNDWSCSLEGDGDITITWEECLASWDCGPPPSFLTCEFK
jgi:hypothetical protein